MQSLYLIAIGLLIACFQLHFSAAPPPPRKSPPPLKAPPPSVKPLNNTVDVLIIGAGIAGLGAARSLLTSNPKLNVLVLEASQRAGGRVNTVTSKGGLPIELGASWIHGASSSNPISQLVSQFGLKTAVSSDDQFYLTNGTGTVVTYKAVNTVYKAFYKWMGSQLETIDQRSILTILNAYLKAKSLSPFDQTLLRAGINSNIVQEYAAGIGSLSAAYFDQDSGFNGDDVMFVNGTIGLINSFVKTGIPIRYGQQVSAVDYSMPTQVKVTTTERAVFIARYVISTLPLGVMQRNTVAWTPALPADKLKAMYMLNMGSLDRITLVFEKNWWDPKKVACWVNRLTSDNGNNLFTEFYSLTNILNRPVLIAFNAGDMAPVFEALNDTAILNGALAALSATFPSLSVPKPAEYFITRWGQNPFSYGSYSSIRANATGNSSGLSPVNDIMGTPLANNRMLFAGEHTQSLYPGTLHGAYLSGKREADRILKLLAAGR